MPNPRVLADPFGIARDGVLHILAEELNFRTGKSISSVQVDAGGHAGSPKPVEDLPKSSYPYLLEYENEIFCIPETAHERRVSLYRATSFPNRWTLVGHLMEGLVAGDPTIFRFQDRWWLICAALDVSRHGSLLAFYADDLLGPWHPHHGNPLKADVRNSRPAGTPFVHGGRLYRPAQDSSATYGGAVALNRVERLTPWDFDERVEKVIEPDPKGPYPKGLHTVSAAGPFTLIDGKRHRLMWDAFRREIRSVGHRRSDVSVGGGER